MDLVSSGTIKCLMKSLTNMLHMVLESDNKDFKREKNLLFLLTKKDVTLTYKKTVLGIFWSLLNPILLAIALFVAFEIFVRIQMENYIFFLLSALFPWNWLSASVTIPQEPLPRRSSERGGRRV